LRLDNYLVENGLAETRNKAQTIIKEGFVLVDEKEIKKSSFKVEEGMQVTVKDHKSYVSRAAYKLKDFLEEIGYEPSGKTALDIGSSTGGFTQVLLEGDAKEVTCVDVGSEQLHHSLRSDERVHVFENCDIRKFESEKTFELIVSDVAFISLLYILDDIERLSSKDIILLFKPQFEVGREVKRDKNGVVTDKKAIEDAMIRFEEACNKNGWTLQNKAPSKTTGKEGNLEYCYYFTK
jgi:23S rRNA (cytidine1920-2'-O)/16S rRNA (cytidine1409-2'-O)-methyltransferase